MNDRRIQFSTNLLLTSLTALIAVGLDVSTFFGLDHRWSSIALLFGVVAGVCQVRSFLCKMSDRERAAFELGRDSVRDIRSAGR